MKFVKLAVNPSRTFSSQYLERAERWTDFYKQFPLDDKEYSCTVEEGDFIRAVSFWRSGQVEKASKLLKIVLAQKSQRCGANSLAVMSIHISMATLYGDCAYDYLKEASKLCPMLLTAPTIRDFNNFLALLKTSRQMESTGATVWLLDGRDVQFRNFISLMKFRIQMSVEENGNIAEEEEERVSLLSAIFHEMKKMLLRNLRFLRAPNASSRIQKTKRWILFNQFGFLAANCCSEVNLWESLHKPSRAMRAVVRSLRIVVGEFPIAELVCDSNLDRGGIAVENFDIPWLRDSLFGQMQWVCSYGEQTGNGCLAIGYIDVCLPFLKDVDEAIKRAEKKTVHLRGKTSLASKQSEEKIPVHCITETFAASWRGFLTLKYCFNVQMSLESFLQAINVCISSNLAVNALENLPPGQALPELISCLCCLLGKMKALQVCGKLNNLLRQYPYSNWTDVIKDLIQNINLLSPVTEATKVYTHMIRMRKALQDNPPRYSSARHAALCAWVCSF